MSLAAESARVMVIRVSTLAVQVPVSIMLARFLGVEGKGLYTLLTVVPWLVSYVLLGGLDTAHSYFLSSRRTGLRPVVIQSVLSVFIISLVGIPVYLLLVAPPVIEGAAQILLLVSALLIPLSLGRYFILSILLGLERAVSFNLLYLVGALIVLVMVTVFVGLLDFGLNGALVAFVAAQGLLLPVGLYWIARERKAAAQIPQDGSAPGESLKGLPLLRSSLAYGLKGHLAGVLVSFNQRFDIFLLGALSTSREVGLYAVAVALAETIWHVPMSIHITLFPRTAAIGRIEGARKLPRACRMTLLLTLSLALAVGALGYPLVLVLFGRPFLPAVIPLIVLLPGVVAVGLANVFESYFAGVDRRQYQSFSVAWAFALSLGLGVTLIPRYGALGAALASTGSYLLQMVLSISLYRRLGKLSFSDFFVPRLKDLKDLLATFRDLLKQK